MKKVYIVYDSLGHVIAAAACEDLAYEICIQWFIENEKKYDPNVVCKGGIGPAYRTPKMASYKEVEIRYE